MDIFVFLTNSMMKKLLTAALITTVFMSATTLKAQNPDAAVEEIVMDDVYAAGSPETINVKFKNAGTTSFSGVTINWSSDGGATVNAYPLNGFPFGPNASFTLAHNVQITFANPGTNTEIMVWTSNPGGQTDANTSNDTLRKQIFVNNGTTVTRNVFIEEFTTAPCGFCPDGAYVLENVLAGNPTAIGLGIHAGFGTDAMTIPEHSTLASAFASGAPSAAIDRVRFSGESNVAISRNVWNSRVNLRRSVGAAVDFVINGSYDAASRTATVTVNANFVDFVLPGDIRLGMYVVEDNVDQTGQGYNQTNYYNTQGGHPYYQAGNPIVGYNHRHVVRDVFPSGNPWGDNNVIPTNPASNGSYSQTYNISIPTTWDVNEIDIVAFVGYYGTSVNDREILNAGKAKLTSLVTNISEVKADLESLNVFPNPSNNISNLKFNLSQSSSVNIELRDLTGKLILQEDYASMSKGNQLIQLNVADLKAGIYFVRLNINNQQITRKISVVD